MMNNLNRDHRFNWTEFLTGVLFIAAAVIIFREPAATLLTLSLIFSLVAIVRGIANIGGFFRISEISGRRPWFILISGALDLIIGLILLFNLVTGVQVLAFLFALWFFFDSLGIILSSGYLRAAGTGWFILQLILGIIDMVFALLLLFSPGIAALSAVWLIAFYMVSFGLSSIVLAFAQWRL